MQTLNQAQEFSGNGVGCFRAVYCCSIVENGFSVDTTNEVARDGIRVNCVSPGHISTDMHASGGEPGRVDSVKDSSPREEAASLKRLRGLFYSWQAPSQSSASDRHHRPNRSADSRQLDDRSSAFCKL
jgi:NAD(P)-dependent dehydrogenase (short-subunit alcohol dehydrogenase family)